MKGLRTVWPALVAMLLVWACGDADVGSTFPDSFPTTTRGTIPRDPFFGPGAPTTGPPGTVVQPTRPPRTVPPGTPPGDEILATSPAGLLRIGSELQAEFFSVGEEEDGGRLEIVAAFGAASGVVVPIDDGDPTGEIFVVVDDEVAYTAEGVDFTEASDGTLRAAGELRRVEDAQDVAFQLELGWGAGSSTFALDGSRAVMSGEIGSGTLAQLAHLINWHPEVDTLVLANVPGSVDDDALRAAGRLVREVGLRTEVPAEGFAASGAVDLFAAGTDRSVGDGATLAVHAWEDPGEGVAADEIPPADARHGPYLDYLSEMLGDVAGPDFYFFTINAAGPDDLHLLTDAEIERYGLVTS